MLSFVVDWGNGPERVTSSLWAIAQWERKTGRKIPSIATEGIAMDDLLFLCHATLVHRGHEVPKNADAWIQQVESFDLVEPDQQAGNPTR